MLTAVMGVIFTAHVIDAHWRPAVVRVIVMATIFATFVLRRGSLQARLPWVLVTAAMAYVLFEIPYRLGNHHFVLGYVGLAMVLNAGKDSERFLADIRECLRWLLVGIMGIATVQRLLSTDFLDGSFLALMFARGAFFQPVFAFCESCQETFLSNQTAMWNATRTYPGIESPVTLTAPFAHFELVCTAFVVLILLGEVAIAAAFAVFRTSWIRHAALFPFALTLGVVRSEFVFAAILCMFGLSQCDPAQEKLRRAYALLAVVLAACIFSDPIELHP
jgi:predicted small integral membrane protein